MARVLGVLSCVLLAMTSHLVAGKDSYGEGASLEIDLSGKKPPKVFPTVTKKLLELLDIRKNESGGWLQPRLLYNHDALEPFMDERTVRVHHTGHHASYTRQ